MMGTPSRGRPEFVLGMKEKQYNCDGGCRSALFFLLVILKKLVDAVNGHYDLNTARFNKAAFYEYRFYYNLS